MADFSPVIQSYILASEGGYVDHPKDPGGATNMGITHKTLAAWRGRSVTKEDVRRLTQAEALAIYEAQYWRAIGADRLPAGLDYAVADYAINSGPSRAVKDLQRVLGVAADGIVGVQTLAALGKYSTIRLIEALCARRAAFVRGLPTYKEFGRGWESRIIAVEVKAKALATGTAAGKTTEPPPAPAKAEPQPVSPIDVMVKDPGSWSGFAGAAAAIVGAIADQPILQVGAIVLVGILLWRFVLVRKNQDPN